MMPLTCGRTSATRDAVVRPGNSAVIATDCGRSVTTLTCGGGGAAAGCSACSWPQPIRTSPENSRTAAAPERRSARSGICEFKWVTLFTVRIGTNKLSWRAVNCKRHIAVHKKLKRSRIGTILNKTATKRDAATSRQRGRPKVMPDADQRAHILECATKLFLTKGYGAHHDRRCRRALPHFQADAVPAVSRQARVVRGDRRSAPAEHAGFTRRL